MRGKGKGDFTRHRSEIAEKISLGWPIKMVWQYCKDAELVDLDYSTFRKYVNSIIGYRPYKNGNGPLSGQTSTVAPSTVEPLEPGVEQAAITAPDTTTARKGTEPKFTEAPPPKAAPEKKQGDGPIMVGTFQEEKPMRPGKKGMALDDDELY
ncbi:TraK family protein [Microbulbifer sp. 2201CG32-9]|uniref:TraK family protein n=1 Tax=Microbulbifer sp. 2201CG32-9 TaxID=3232309 RepID=UPI00345C0BB7